MLVWTAANVTRIGRDLSATWSGATQTTEREIARHMDHALHQDSVLAKARTVAMIANLKINSALIY